MTTTLHIENTVHDYDSWKLAFDKFDRFRAENGVRSYRVTRSADDPHEVVVELDFDSTGVAEAFAQLLQKVWQTPQSQQHLVRHSAPTMRHLVENRAF
ncbi:MULTISPECIES: hypothetical protein [unclassified Nocardioides]|uniref:hypothetical protein n=1 Tax=unclassified Nocardioides TaxID=2615069 RepID=UPI0006FE3E20|nr:MULTISPECIES: hypothetical protein [unclassified Nocardioides]KRA39373.1 hypothetical protein ASD81_05055 [Nocardioides sp. Root614]KRA93338.1 hypothetical protein ASD84_05320 [Nocardioides sp. Root682]